jgi:hypothetical protein
MIIGRGSIASMLKDREGIIFFAAGVSNSKDLVLRTEFLREHDALLQFAGDRRLLVYFSTISQYLGVSDYVIHKVKMEGFVKSWFPNYCILRIGNIYEDTNPNTFINYIKAKQSNGEPVEIRENEMKYMISKKQLLFITDNIPLTGKHEISIFGELLKVSECLKQIK